MIDLTELETDELLQLYVSTLQHRQAHIRNSGDWLKWDSQAQDIADELHTREGYGMHQTQLNNMLEANWIRQLN